MPTGNLMRVARGVGEEAEQTVRSMRTVLGQLMTRGR